jgi:hypothetical protein
LGNQAGQPADVIEVCVREDNAVDAVGKNGKGRPVTQAKLFEPLEHSAVNQEPSAVDVQEVLGAGDGSGGSEKR